MTISVLLGELTSELRTLYTLDFGYPLGENVIRQALPVGPRLELLRAINVPLDGQLARFYDYADGISLPDVRNGLFIHSLQLILRGIETGEPTRIVAEGKGQIVCFGSDGGGGRFALRRSTGEIVQLPQGRVEAGLYDGPVKTVAGDFNEFLRLVVATARAFVRDTPGFEYVV